MAGQGFLHCRPRILHGFAYSRLLVGLSRLNMDHGLVVYLGKVRIVLAKRNPRLHEKRVVQSLFLNACSVANPPRSPKPHHVCVYYPLLIIICFLT